MTLASFRLILVIACLTSLSSIGIAQETASPLDEEGRMVSFERDIAPIFADHCLECHDEKNAKGGFQIDDPEFVIDYLEPGDWAASILITEYLLSEDPDMLMPPESHGGPLSAAELALIRIWVDEGADWPDDVSIGAMTTEASQETVVEPPAAVKSLPARLWAFQGFFHPATVHFPVALLLVGGLFVVVGWKSPAIGDHVALACLFLGTLSAIAASAMGWAFATQQGYGSWSKVDTDSVIFWHRWSAIIVTVIAVITSLVALSALKTGATGTRRAWKCGLILLAALIGAVGHQGGELTYGETHYTQAFQILRGESAKSRPTTEPSTPAQPTADEPAADNEPDDEE